MEKHSKVSGGLIIMSSWFEDQFGIPETDPFTTDPDELAEKAAEKTRSLYGRYSDIPIGSPDLEPHYTMPMHDGRVVCAVAYGAPNPVWDNRAACWWTDTSHQPWSGIKSVSDVESMEIPDWRRVPLVQQMIDKCAEIRARRKYPLDSRNGFPWIEMPWADPWSGDSFRLTAFMNFVDLGAFLCGDTEFLSMLAADPEVADAMLKKCFEISTSYSDFVRAIYGLDLVGLCTFGGDYSCVLSPEMYRQYAMTHDMMMLNRYGDLPCNLHSCGPSSHLYETWATYPNRDKIVVMQTRGIAGETRRLRRALPKTHLQISILTPQFDFEHDTPDNIEALLWQYAEDADFRDVSLHAIMTRSDESIDRNVRTFYSTISKINDYAIRLE